MGGWAGSPAQPPMANSMASISTMVKFFFIVAETAAQASKGVGCTYDYGIAQFGGSLARLFDVLAGFALDCLYVYLVKAFYEQLAVFSIHDGLDWCAEYSHAVLLEYSALV